MKKLLSAVFFLTLCCSAANAHPVKVTLSNGQVVYLESDNYESAQVQHRTAIPSAGVA